MPEPDPLNYRSRVMINVLNAVVEAGSFEGSDDSMVELQVAVQGMCDAIAMLVAASGEERIGRPWTAAIPLICAAAMC